MSELIQPIKTAAGFEVAALSNVIRACKYAVNGDCSVEIKEDEMWRAVRAAGFSSVATFKKELGEKYGVFVSLNTLSLIHTITKKPKMVEPPALPNVVQISAEMKSDPRYGAFS